MKKIKLRKIIRESVKELIKEQTLGQFKKVLVQTCEYPGQVGVGIVCIKGNPQAGDTYEVNQQTASTLGGWISVIGTRFFVKKVMGPCDSTTLAILPTPTTATCDRCCMGGQGQYGGWWSSYAPYAATPQGACWANCQGAPPAGGCPPCDAAAWPNYSTWVSNWTSLPNFTSTNPNQPCNMICNKIQQWTNACQNAGPVQQNQLACKIEEGQNQAQIHNCNC